MHALSNKKTDIQSRTVKPVLSGHSKKDHKWVFKTNYRLMQVNSIAECSKGSILQYCRPAFEVTHSFKTFFCLFLSDRLRQISM